MAETIRTKAEIEADIAAARERLAHEVTNLINQVHPRAVTHRAVADVRDRASRRVYAVRDQLVEPDGSLNTRHAALLGAAVAGSVAFFAVVRSIVRR